MPSSGPKNPSSAINQSRGGTNWSNLTNVFTSDTNRATCSLNPGDISNYAIITGFGFTNSDIPVGSTIVGILDEVQRRNNGTAAVKDDIVKQYLNGGIAGNNNALSSNWESSDTYASHGGSSDLWGLSISEADIKNNANGVAVAVICSGNFGQTGSAAINHVRRTVYYVPPQQVALDGSIVPSGVMSSTMVKILSVDGSIQSSGTLGVIPVLSLILGGIIALSGNLTQVIKMALSGTITSIGTLINKFITIFYWATHFTIPESSSKYPQILLELASDESLITGSSPSIEAYERRIIDYPAFEKTESDTMFGISSFGQTDVKIANLDKKLTLERDIRGFFARIWRIKESVIEEFRGIVRGFNLGLETTITIEDLDSQIFNSSFPKRIITTDLFPTATDLGKPIPIVFGRALKLPLYYIGKNEDGTPNRDNTYYDYLLGEGTGLNGNHFKQVFTVYDEDAVMEDIEGNIAGGDLNSLILENADRRFDGWYKWFWIQILDTDGVTILDENRWAIAYDSATNTITPNSSFSVNPIGKKYRLRMWRFYNGSQSSPYSGFAFIRFKKRIGDLNKLDNLYADVDGLQDEKNYARAIQSLISNPVWGLGLDVDTGEFDSVANDSGILSISCEGAIKDSIKAIDLFASLLTVRDMSLHRNGSNSIGIDVDAAKISTGSFGWNDGYWNNVTADGFQGIQFKNVNELVNRLTVNYRFDNKSNSYVQLMTRQANGLGDDKFLDLPFCYSSEDAYKILYYKTERLKGQDRVLPLVGKKQWEIKRRDAVKVFIPAIGISGQMFEVIGLRKENELLNMSLSLDTPQAYILPDPPDVDFPPTESQDIAPDFSNTPPDPVSNLHITANTLDANPDGSVISRVDIAWDPPEDNYTDAMVSVKLSSDTLWTQIGTGFDTFSIKGLVPGLNYDIMVESRGINTALFGLAEELTGVLISGDTTIPKTPTGLASIGQLYHVGWKWNAVTENTDNTTLIDSDVYEFEVYPNNNLNNREQYIEIKPSDNPQFDYLTQASNLSTPVTKYGRVRMRDKSGHHSNWTSLVSSSTQSGTTKNSARNDADITITPSGAVLSVSLTTFGGPVEIWANTNVRNNDATASGGGRIAVLRNGSEIRFNWIPSGFTDINPAQPDFHFTDFFAPAQTNTYTLQYTNGDTVIFYNRFMSVEELRA